MTTFTVFNHNQMVVHCNKHSNKSRPTLNFLIKVSFVKKLITANEYTL